MDGEKTTSKMNEKVPEINKEGWNTKEIAEQGVNENPDDVVRRTLREDEGKRGGDERDVAGTVNSNETPQGREESKK